MMRDHRPNEESGAGAAMTPCRSVMLEPLPADASYEEVCKLVGVFGVIESMRIVFERNQAFINFVTSEASCELMQHAETEQGLVFRSGLLNVHWSKSRQLEEGYDEAIRRGARRSLYLSGLPASTTEESITSIFGGFGEIASVRLMRKEHWRAHTRILHHLARTRLSVLSITLESTAPCVPEPKSMALSGLVAAGS